jgi:hypothetical protein
MSVLSLPLAFRIGESLGRPGTLSFSTAFRVGEGSGRPTTVSFSLVFGVQGFGRPSVLTIPTSFAITPPPPDDFVFVGTSWLAVAQRAWTGERWFP